MKKLEKRIRVKVLDAGMENCLGEGWIVAEGTSYCFATGVTCPECNHQIGLVYTSDEQPSLTELERLKKRKITVAANENDVKILLDNGQEVYGSSTWWQPIPEEHKG